MIFMDMKTQEEILQELKESFNEFYSPKINESNEQFTSIEEFRQHWHEIIDKVYDKIENENSNK